MSDTSHQDPQPPDPYREPDNATTEEWFGQSVERDAELAEELLAEEGGDEEAAAERFDEEATGEIEQRRRRGERTT